jgi:hypothetical protein
MSTGTNNGDDDDGWDDFERLKERFKREDRIDSLVPMVAMALIVALPIGLALGEKYTIADAAGSEP